MDPKALHRDNDVPAMYRSKKKKKMYSLALSPKTGNYHFATLLLIDALSKS